MNIMMNERKIKAVKVVVRNYVVRNRNFVVVQYDDGWYGAIEDKYIDANGKLTKQLNGLQVHHNENLNDCLEMTRNTVEMDYLIANGKTWGEAICIIHNLPMEKAKALDAVMA